MSIEIPRFYKQLDSHCHPNKVLVLYGPRQSGKTTLLQKFLRETQFRYKLDSGDNILTQHVLRDADFKTIQEYAAGYDLIAIDEAQRIPNIGQALKILVDTMPGLRVIATGSSSFELAGQVGEPLTGRRHVLTLFPVAQLELAQIYNRQELKNHLEEYLIYGAYPEVASVETLREKRLRITEITESYLLKDILELDSVKNSKSLINLLRLLAFQVGNEVSYSELAQKVMLDTKTVMRYIDLLEKSFVLYNLRGFSRNLRKEIVKKSKFYFYDLGIRNALLANFNSLDKRNDVGNLWENFLIIERLKKQAYYEIYANNYFWRTWDQKEIDFVEEREGNLFAYEFKWNEQVITQPPKDWAEAYKNAEFMTINQKNYLKFIVDKEA